MPMRRPRPLRISSGDRVSMRWPPRAPPPPMMRPGGSSRPMTAAPVSDLPAPDSPTTPRTPPAAMSTETAPAAGRGGRPAGGDVEGGVVDRGQRGAPCRKRHREVADGEDRLAHGLLLGCDEFHVHLVL